MSDGEKRFVGEILTSSAKQNDELHACHFCIRWILHTAHCILCFMKYLGIDFGSKKVGYAQSDDEGLIAFPLMISANDKNLLKDTIELIRELKITTVVMGESVDRNGKPNKIAKEVRSFGAQIEKAIDVKVVFEKEWYSTVEARKQPGNEDNHEVDDQAAAIVLQRYLDKLNGPVIVDEEVLVDEDDDSVIQDTQEESW